MALPVIPRLCPTPFQLCLGLGVSELEGVFFAIIGELMQNVGVDFGRRCEFSCVIVVCSFTLMPAPLGFKIGNICITWDASLGEPLHCLCASVTSQNRMRVLEMVRSRHGMITGFKLYRGLESHGFKSTKCSVIPFLRYAQVFTCRQRRKVQWRAHESHGSQCQWELPVCIMIAEGDETLELFPPSKNTKSAVWEFFR